MTEFAGQIKEAVSMRMVAERYGLSINRRQHKALCPFHQDSKPSMHIYDGKKGWFCFVCNQGGDVIDFTMRFFGLTFKQAEEKLNEDFCLHLPMGTALTESERDAARRAEHERKVRQRKRAEREKLLWAAYHSAFDCWTTLDDIIRLKSPRTPLDSFDLEYVYACQHIDAAWNDVESALNGLFEFEKGGDEGSGTTETLQN